MANVSAENKPRILLVDDESDIATILKLGLEKGGFEVEAITDPTKALELFEKDRDFDLALLDIRMPKMNGFELYRKLLELDNRLRVCFITSFEIYHDEFKRVFPKVHVDCFVHKPVSIEKLTKIIKGELEREQVLELPIKPKEP